MHVLFAPVPLHTFPSSPVSLRFESPLSSCRVIPSTYLPSALPLPLQLPLDTVVSPAEDQMYDGAGVPLTPKVFSF